MLRKAVDKTKAYYCLECGVCTGSCPVSRYDPAYSPRLTVERALLADERGVLCDKGLWSCLTCGTCNQRCPSLVDYTEFVRQARGVARDLGETGVCTHAEKIAAVLELQRAPVYRRSRAWLGSGVKTAERGDTYYFAGCLPYLDVIFREVGFGGREIGRSAVEVLNRLGIVPAMSEAEVCCGHDAYWTGQGGLARELALKNLEAMKRAGAKRAVFSCPECFHMFRKVYPDLVGSVGVEPVLLISLIAERLADLPLAPAAIKATYQDPCRLARFEQVTEQPRALLKAIPQLELAEMKRAGREALCCGSSSWVSCSRINKRIQLERLAEAKETGAGTLVTACPKCNIHLRCALRDKDGAGDMEITDLVTLVARSLAARKPGGRPPVAHKGRPAAQVRRRRPPKAEVPGGKTRGGGKRGG